jgi:hypothetical protein
MYKVYDESICTGEPLRPEIAYGIISGFPVHDSYRIDNRDELDKLFREDYYAWEAMGQAADRGGIVSVSADPQPAVGRCVYAEAQASLPLLLHELTEARKDKFAGLPDLFVCQRAKRLEKYAGSCFGGLRGYRKRDLKFCFGHVLGVLMPAARHHSRESHYRRRKLPAW